MSVTRVVLIRHAEEATERGRGPNLNERGLPDQGGLSLKGWQRAGALVPFFVPMYGGASVGGPGKPTAIVAMGSTPEQPSRRPALTVGLVAQALRLDVQLASAVDRLPSILAGMRGCVLICWRHASLPAAATVVAPLARVPPEWPEDRYDLMWTLDFEKGIVRFRQLGQGLLPGDPPVRAVR